MARVGDSVWSRTLDFVRLHHHSLIRDWFDELELAQMANGVLEVHVASPQRHRYLSERCRAAFVEAAQAATGRLVTVVFTLSPQNEAPGDTALLDEPEFTLNVDYRFEYFVTGPCNRLAHAACVAVSDAPGRAYNPLFVHGTSGLGKSHLLQAVCHKVRGASDLKVLYLPCETFANHFLDAVQHGKMRDFRYRYRHVDLLVIDDVQLLAERERSQEEFFHTFNTLYQSHKQIILSSDSPPREIPSLEERLISRFNWGLVTRLDPPCLETRMAILRSKAKLKCIDLPEDVARYIASRVDANTRELEGALAQVHAHSQHYSRRVTVELAAEALSGDATSVQRPVSISAIVEAVVEHFPVKASEIHGRKRTRSVALPRQVCMYLARELTSLSLDEIGSYFGGRDHSTVIHASRTVAAQREQNPALDQRLSDIAYQLRRR